MSSTKKSCGVAFPTERNCATSDTDAATIGATTLQPMGLKALASKVLQRNKERNSPATSEKLDRNFSAETLEVVSPAATVANRRTIPVLCQGCTQLEVVEILGKRVSGCLYIAPGAYFDGWRRLPADLTKCLFH